MTREGIRVRDPDAFLRHTTAYPNPPTLALAKTGVALTSSLLCGWSIDWLIIMRNNEDDCRVQQAREERHEEECGCGGYHTSAVHVEVL